jgi:hypothetical protein
MPRPPPAAAAAAGPRPASHTKHEASLLYPLPSLGAQLRLAQDSARGQSTGTTLWLSAQIAACWLQAHPVRAGKAAKTSEEGTSAADGSASTPALDPPTPLRALELGSGTGFLAMVLALQGLAVLATDIEPPLSSVLRPNLAANGSTAVAAPLDWADTPGDSSGIGSADDEMRAADWLAQLGAAAGVPSPWDVLVSADTIYHPQLLHPLCRTLRAAVLASRRDGVEPHVLLALERRDPALVDEALRTAERHGFALQRLPPRKVRRAVDAHLGSAWPRDEWEEVELWTLQLVDDAALLRLAAT